MNKTKACIAIEFHLSQIAKANGFKRNLELSMIMHITLYKILGRFR